MPKTVRTDRVWPTTEVLLAWFIFHKLDITPVGDMDSPEEMLLWIREYKKLGTRGVHKLLYGEYEEFRLEFHDPENEEAFQAYMKVLTKIGV